MSRYIVETITPDVADKALVKANSIDQAAFIAGALFGASAVLHLDELYLMGRLSGISAVQEHLERSLAEVDVYVDYAE